MSTKPELVVAIRQSENLPGNKQTSPETKLVLVWNDTAEPSGFYWRNTDSWQKCDINLAHNYDKKTYAYSPQLLTTAIKAGDTLELKPMSGVKGAIPDAIQDGRDNVLYYQMANGIWQGLPVNNFEDLLPVMPTPSQFK